MKVSNLGNRICAFTQQPISHWLVTSGNPEKVLGVWEVPLFSFPESGPLLPWVACQDWFTCTGMNPASTFKELSLQEGYLNWVKLGESAPGRTRGLLKESFYDTPPPPLSKCKSHRLKHTLHVQTALYFNKILIFFF